MIRNSAWTYLQKLLVKNDFNKNIRALLLEQKETTAFLAKIFAQFFLTLSQQRVGWMVYFFKCVILDVGKG